MIHVYYKHIFMIVQIIYSAEKPLVGLVKLEEEQVNHPNEFGAVDNFRLRTIPVIGTMPAVMGVRLLYIYIYIYIYIYMYVYITYMYILFIYCLIFCYVASLRSLRSKLWQLMYSCK
jgi:hypothetical protein